MTRSTAPTFRALLDFAHLLADRSGDAILPYFRKPIHIDDKGVDGRFDPVTAADRAAERVIDKLVARDWPAHGIVGEEYGGRSPEARFRWVIDPIDGTRSFIIGAPTWGTLIGLMDGEEVVLGMMNQPYTRERFWSSRDGAHLRQADGRSRRIKTRNCPRLASAVVTTTHPDLFAPGAERAAFGRLAGQARMTRYGGDCYSYCLLAAGFVDIVVETGLKPHDVVALIPIIERAGGLMTTWTGEPATAGGRIVAAGDARLHREAMRVLAG